MLDDRKGPHGDNGTVKIHDASTGEEDRRNEPHVCEFYLVGFGFDAEQEVEWEIKAWPPTGDKETVSADALVLDGDGHGRTDDLALPDGHYRLVWTFEGQKGKAKHKNFWVECEEDGEEEPSPQPSPSPDPGGEETEPPEETESPSPTPSNEPEPDGDEPGEPDTSETPPAEEDRDPASDEEDSGGLPVTGAALAGLVSAALLALGGGGTAMYVARKRRSGSADETL